MRSRLPLFIILFMGLSLALPHLAHATTIPYWGPIVPSNDATCAAAWDGIIQLLNNTIAFGITIILAFVAPLMFAYAGFLYVVNPVNPSGRSKANEMMLNIIIGIVLALAAYLIVDFLLSSLTSQGVSGWTAQMFSNGTAPCLSINTSTLSQSAGANGLSTGAAASNVPFSPSGQGSCDPSVVQQAATAGGYSITSAQASELACISQYESACGSANPKGIGTDNLNYNWGQGSSAAGAYQVLLSTNSSCYNNAPCESAGGTPGVALNCSAGFSGGNPIPGSAVAQMCENAAGNVTCSAAAASCLLQQQSFSQAYGANANAASCSNQYGGS